MLSERDAAISQTRFIGLGEASVAGLLFGITVKTAGDHASPLGNVEPGISKTITIVENLVHNQQLFVATLMVSAITIFFLGDGLRRIEKAEEIVIKNAKEK